MDSQQNNSYIAIILTRDSYVSNKWRKKKRTQLREKLVKNKQNVCENKQINETYYRKRKEKRDWNEKNLRKKNYATYLTRQQKTIIRPKNVMRY